MRLFLDKWSMDGPSEKVTVGQGFEWSEPSTDSEKQVFQMKGMVRVQSGVSWRSVAESSVGQRLLCKLQDSAGLPRPHPYPRPTLSLLLLEKVLFAQALRGHAWSHLSASLIPPIFPTSPITGAKYVINIF